jgi:hypothetical protein
MPNSVEEVNNTVRPLFEKNVEYVKQFLQGRGIDMGCGSCPLLKPTCIYYVDMSPQPLCEEQISPGSIFMNTHFENLNFFSEFNFVFSSHALEDLDSEEDIRGCLIKWTEFLVSGGYIVLLLPDVEGGRYPEVEDGGNISHKVKMGFNFMRNIVKEIPDLEIVQHSTIPWTSETFDMVLRKI